MWWFATHVEWEFLATGAVLVLALLFVSFALAIRAVFQDVEVAVIERADIPASFIDIDGHQKPGGSMTLEDFADQELKHRNHDLAALREIASLNHPYAHWARLAIEAANAGQWPRAKALWSNRVCAQ